MNKQRLDKEAATLGWCALLAWWGLSILIDPISLGMSSLGTGLILLGVNGARLAGRVQPRATTTAVGAMALAWGALELLLRPNPWASVAIALIVVALVWGLSFLASQEAPASSEPPGQDEARSA